MIYDKEPTSDFAVSLENDPRCGINARCQKKVHVLVDGVRVVLGELMENDKIHVTVDGKSVLLPHTKTIPSIRRVKLFSYIPFLFQYNEPSLKQTPLGTSLTVRLRIIEVFILEKDDVIWIDDDVINNYAFFFTWAVLSSTIVICQTYSICPVSEHTIKKCINFRNTNRSRYVLCEIILITLSKSYKLAIKCPIWDVFVCLESGHCPF